ALADSRTLDDLGGGSAEHGVQRSRCAVPNEAQDAARGLGRGSPQLEGLVLPVRGTMEIDHLVPDVHRAGGWTLQHIKSKPAIESQHRLGVLHRESDVIEAPHGSGRLGSRAPGSDACGNRVPDKPAPARHYTMIADRLRFAG